MRNISAARRFNPDRARQLARSGHVLVSVGLSVGLLAGCAALGGTGAVLDTYDLVAPAAVSAEPVRRGTQVLIVEPVAVRALDSQNIVVETAPFTIEYLGGAQWGDRLPRLVQSRLAETFERADRFAGIGLPGQGLAIDYQIVTDIRSFGIDLAAGIAQVDIAVKLLNDRNGVIVADRQFEATVPISSSGDPDTYVRALNAAFADVSARIVAWVAERI